MTWNYRQSVGAIAHDGTTEDIGYSGRDEGLNNPAAETDPGEGPIPHGRYRIGAAETHPRLGSLAMPLTPLPGTDTHGRSGFFIHGDNSAMNHTASHGCIILPRATRLLIARSGDHVLEVTA